MKGALTVFGVIATMVVFAVSQAAHPLPSHSALSSQQGLARLFFTSRTMSQDPLNSMACFADYVGHSSLIGETYGRHYNLCRVKANSSRQQVDGEMTAERQDIVVTSEQVCHRLRVCNECNSTLDLFNCHANVGVDNTKDSYAVSGNASEFATLLQERYRLIDLHHEQCCHGAEREYVESTANNYNHLQACLDGRVKPRPNPELSTSSSTTTTTTPIPTSTTTASTTSTTAAASTTDTPPTETHEGIQEQFAQLLNLLN